MDQPPKEIRIRIEAPHEPPAPGPSPLNLNEETVSRFYYGLLFLAFVFSGLGIYFSFFTH